MKTMRPTKDDKKGSYSKLGTFAHAGRYRVPDNSDLEQVTHKKEIVLEDSCSVSDEQGDQIVKTEVSDLD